MNQIDAWKVVKGIAEKAIKELEVKPEVPASEFPEDAIALKDTVDRVLP